VPIEVSAPTDLVGITVRGDLPVAEGARREMTLDP